MARQFFEICATREQTELTVPVLSVLSVSHLALSRESRFKVLSVLSVPYLGTFEIFSPYLPPFSGKRARKVLTKLTKPSR